MDNFKTFVEKIKQVTLIEMIVRGNPIKNSWIIAFNKYIFILTEENKHEIYPDILESLKRFPFKIPDIMLDDNYIDTTIDDMANNLVSIAKDIMVGKILENINDELVIVPLAKFDIRSSNITHKIYNELGLHFLDSIYEYDYDPLDEYDYLTIEEYSNFPSIGFHGTSSKYLTSILRLGIRYNSGNTNWENVVKNDTHKHIIFFSTKSETPLFHANTLIKKQSDGSIPIIIKFEIPSKKLVVHDYDIERDVNSDKYKPIYVKSKSPKKKTFTNNPMTQSLHVGIYGYLGNIPPKFITGVAIPKFPNSDKQFEKDDFIMLEPREALKKLNLYY